MKKIIAPLSVFTCFFAFSAFAENDNVTRLKDALRKLEGKAPISAVYERNNTEISDADDKDDRKETTGSISVSVAIDDAGLHITYPQLVLETMELEAQAQAADEEADTPTLNAVGSVNAKSFSYQLSAAKSILRRIEKATFIEDENITYNGNPATVVRFSLPLESIITDAKTRSYVSKFEGIYSIIMDENGYPIQIDTEFNGKGRAFLVLSVKVKNSESSVFTVIDDRLVRLQHEYENEIQSSFGDNVSIGKNTMKLSVD